MLGTIAVDVLVSECASGVGAGCALAALFGTEADSSILRRDAACRCVCEAPRRPWVEICSGWIAFGLLLAFLIGILVGVGLARSCVAPKPWVGPTRRPWGAQALAAHAP